MPVTPAQLLIFSKLFEGSVHSFGQWDRNSGKMFTVKEPPTVANFKDHLDGKKGIGIVPIYHDRFSKWGAIDIEEENLRDAGISIFDLESTVRERNLPLMVCRSKSGGAHLYFFLNEAIPTAGLRGTLTDWAGRVGFGGVEVFPKQNETSDSALGNWINLPYFDSGKTERYMVEGGKKQPFSYFLEAAQTAAASKAYMEVFEQDHAEAPPCIQAMLAGKVPKGARNEALYGISVYLKRAFPDGYKQKAFDANSKFEAPLPHAEARKTIDSATRRDYKYKCSQEPCRSLCDSNTCITRKFGITPSEEQELKAEVSTVARNGYFSHLRKYVMEPVHWKLDVDGQEVTVPTAILMDFAKLRAAIADAHTKLIPVMKDKDWHLILTQLMEGCEFIETPDEASTSGFVRSRLREFTSKAARNGDEALHDRNLLYRGMPIVEERGQRKVVYFRGTDFVEFLKKTRSEELKGVNLWLALKKAGVDYTRIKVNGFGQQVWYVDLDEDSGEIVFQEKDYAPEF